MGQRVDSSSRHLAVTLNVRLRSVSESALDDLDLNDFGVSALERSLESSSTLPSVGAMLGI